MRRSDRLTRIFICTVGLTPQVATETLDVLLHDRTPGWRPDRIELISTTKGVAGARPLLDPAGPLSTLFAGEAPPVSLYVPVSPRPGDTLDAPMYRELAWPGGAHPAPPPPVLDGLMADDASPQDAIRMGDTIKDRIGAWTRDEATMVHVSIAGGRKTMSANALMALSLVGRLVDEASHVLVEDQHFEGVSEFWHRQQGGMVCGRRLHGEPLDAPPPERPAAEIGLRLSRVRVPGAADLKGFDRAQLIKLKLSDAAWQMELAAGFDEAPAIAFDDAANSITMGPRTAVLQPASYARLRFLVEMGCRRPPGATLRECRAISYGLIMYDATVAPAARVNPVRDFLHAVDTAFYAAGSGPVVPPAKAAEAWARAAAVVARTMQGDLLRAPAKTTAELKKILHSVFGSFTEVRNDLAAQLGVWIADRLVTVPKHGTFRFGCPPGAIRISRGLLSREKERDDYWDQLIAAEDATLPISRKGA